MGKDINLPLRPGEKPDPSIARRQGKGAIANILKGYGVAKEVAKKKKDTKKDAVSTAPSKSFMSRFGK